MSACPSYGLKNPPHRTKDLHPHNRFAPTIGSPRDGRQKRKDRIAKVHRQVRVGALGEKPDSAINELRPSVHPHAHEHFCGGPSTSARKKFRCSSSPAGRPRASATFAACAMFASCAVSFPICVTSCATIK